MLPTGSRVKDVSTDEVGIVVSGTHLGMRDAIVVEIRSTGQKRLYSGESLKNLITLKRV